MKKSQIFLGALSIVLAIAGALATRASHNNIKHLACYTLRGVGHCIALVPFTTIQHNGSTIARTANGTLTLYTCQRVGGISICGKPLYTNPQN